MVEAALAVALGIVLSVVFFIALIWIVSEVFYIAWLWKNRRKRRYHG